MKLKAKFEICKKCPNYKIGHKTIFPDENHKDIQGFTALCKLKHLHPIYMMHTGPVAYSLKKRGGYYFNQSFIVPQDCSYRLEFILK